MISTPFPGGQGKTGNITGDKVCVFCKEEYQRSKKKERLIPILRLILREFIPSPCTHNRKCRFSEGRAADEPGPPAAALIFPASAYDRRRALSRSSEGRFSLSSLHCPSLSAQLRTGTIRGGAQRHQLGIWWKPSYAWGRGGGLLVTLGTMAFTGDVRTHQAQETRETQQHSITTTTVTSHFLILHMWFMQNQITFRETAESEYLV